MARRVTIRRVRDGVELRVDGTLASHYGSARHQAGPVWMAIAAPVVLLPPARRRRVLILGLGGGTAARVVRALAPDARIVGVEIDGDVLSLARAHLGLDEMGIETVHADAREFLRTERGRWDLVIEDVFVGPSRTVRKPDWMIEDGLPKALALAGGGGIVASNTIHETGRVARALEASPGGCVAIGVAGYWNRIVACGAAVGDAATVRAQLAREPLLKAALSRLSVRTLR